jgi:hypothetical protein
MVDPVQYILFEPEDQEERRVLAENIPNTSVGPKICSCSRCERLVHKFAAKNKFEGYGRVNPITTEILTDHQYFLCDSMVEAFLYNIREWSELSAMLVGEPANNHLIFRVFEYCRL